MKKEIENEEIKEDLNEIGWNEKKRIWYSN